MRSIEESQKLYRKMLHAIQSGVAFEMLNGGRHTQPKHLRIGINAGMCDHAGLVGLLVSKGIFTWQEIHNAIADQMVEEVKAYEKRLSDQTGRDVTLD